jgi:lysine decarboxylase
MMLSSGKSGGKREYFAIMGPHGVYYKDEPIKELEAALQRQGFQTIWPQNSADLLQFIEHNPRICGIFDWDEYSVDLCSDIIS